MAYEQPLDKEQQAAVEATERAIAVLAGPGSGKTRVLSYRARHLLMLDRSANALLLTFTNKAAAEMKARAIAVTPAMSDRIRAGTFHHFAMGVLRAHGTHVGIDADFDILDEKEQADLILAAAAAAGTPGVGREYSVQRLRKQLHTANEAVFGKVYEQLKREEGVVDFDDLIVYTGFLFDRMPEIARAYATKYQHILVDEFQDTNNAQFAMVRALAEHANTMSVFADDDQAIFGFAGGETRNIARFCEDIQAREYPLTTNYRCRDEIVKCANQLIKANRAQGRRMSANKPNGLVHVQAFDDVLGEARFICDDIEARIEESEEAHDIAILVRSTYRVREIVRMLAAREIPYSNWLGASYKSEEQRVIRTCLTVIRPVLSDRSGRMLSEILDVTDVGIRDTADFLEANRDRPGIEHLLEVRRLARAGAKVSEILGGVANCIESVQDTVGFCDSIVAEVAAFEEHDPEYSLDHFLGDLALGGKGGAPTEGGGVKVATLHRTKGLQWPHVYLVGLEQGTLPDYRSMSDADKILEERRLCFVGVCRAEDTLSVTWIHQYNGHVKSASRFLQEMSIG